MGECDGTHLDTFLAYLEDLNVIGSRSFDLENIIILTVAVAALVTKPTQSDIEELEEIGEPRGEMGPALYLASQLAGKEEDKQPVYSSYLGLAIEPLNEGFSLKSLFEVQTSS